MSKIYRQYPFTISEHLYDNLSEENKDLGWIYNWNCRCYTHYFLTKKQLKNFMKKVIKKLKKEKKI